MTKLPEPAPPAIASFYRRPLPDGLVAFGSPEGRQLFREALAEGGLEGWFALAEQFHTQADPAFCGPGTLVVALNALEIDPGRIWKGPWRWYGEELLDCCVPLAHVRQKGVTLDELACLSRCNGAKARSERADRAGVDELRADVRAAAAAPRGPVVVAGYSRARLGQTGAGHFSPVGGYHQGRDLALVLDVARFKYPPHWVPLERLWQAMTEVDPATGRARGWIVLERGQQRTTTLLFRLTAGDGLQTLVTTLLEKAPTLLAKAGGDSVEAVLGNWASAVDAQMADQICQSFGAQAGAGAGDGGTPGPSSALSPEHQAVVETLLGQLHASAAYRALACGRVGGRDGRVPAELLAILLLALPETALADQSAHTRELLAPLRDTARLGTVLGEEVSGLRAQLSVLRGWQGEG